MTIQSVGGGNETTAELIIVDYDSYNNYISYQVAQTAAVRATISTQVLVAHKKMSKSIMLEHGQVTPRVTEMVCNPTNGCTACFYNPILIF